MSCQYQSRDRVAKITMTRRAVALLQLSAAFDPDSLTVFL
jgi:hypothetical protein